MCSTALLKVYLLPVLGITALAVCLSDVTCFKTRWWHDNKQADVYNKESTRSHYTDTHDTAYKHAVENLKFNGGKSKNGLSDKKNQYRKLENISDYGDRNAGSNK